MHKHACTQLIFAYKADLKFSHTLQWCVYSIINGQKHTLLNLRNTSDLLIMRTLNNKVPLVNALTKIN